MKNYFQQYRPFFIFLLKFFGVYVGLTLIYEWYLSRFESVLAFEVDGFTQSVAQQVQWVLNTLHVSGTVLIHILNVLRIALLSVALYYHPDQEAILHGVVFPLIIYGFVFGLWVIWVNQFSNYAGKTAQ